jgi:hypothetical protein
MNFETLLGKIEAQRPDLADSISLIRQFQKEKKDTDTPNTDTEAGNTEELRTIIEKQRKINKSLLQQYQQLEDNYKLLVTQLDQLAEAIGACPQCWGEDINCNYCRGRGKPGYFQPNQEYFDLYIKPVILKLKTSKS